MPDLVFSTKGAAAVADAYQKLGDAQKKLSKETDDGNEKAVKGAKERIHSLQLTGQEVRRLDRLQQEIARRNETALDTYNRKLADARRALAGHRDETSLMAKEQARLRIEYLKATDGGKRSAAEQAASLEKAKQRAAELRGEVTGIGTAQKSAFGAGAAKQIAAWGAGFLTVSATVRGITAEIQKQQELINKRNAAQLTVSESRNVLLRNLVGSSDAEIAKAQAAAVAISRKTGVSEKYVNFGLADAISASGGDIPASVAAVEASARFLPDRPDEIGSFSGTLLDLAKVSGTTDANVNLGLLTLVGKQGRVVNPKLQAENIAPALIGAGSFGFNASEGGALFAALSNAVSDKTGALSGTAVIQLAKQLRQFEPLGGASGAEAIRKLQGDRQLAETFLADASFETKALGPIQQLLLDPQSQAAQQFSQNLAAIPGNKGLALAGTAALDISRKNTLETVAQRRRQLETALEGIQTDKARTGAISREERDLVVAIAQETGSTGIGAELSDYVTNLSGGGQTSVDAVLGNLRKIRDQVAHPTTTRYHSGGIAGYVTTEERATTAQERRDLAILQQLISTLEKSEESRKQQASESNELLRETRDAIADGGLPAGGD